MKCFTFIEVLMVSLNAKSLQSCISFGRVPQYKVSDKIQALDTSGFFETLINMIDELGPT